MPAVKGLYLFIQVFDVFDIFSYWWGEYELYKYNTVQKTKAP